MVLWPAALAGFLLAASKGCLMPKTKDLRKELEEAGARAGARQGRLDKAEGDLARLLVEAKASRDLTMSDAAKLAGVGRTMAYKLIRGRGSTNA